MTRPKGRLLATTTSLFLLLLVPETVLAIQKPSPSLQPWEKMIDPNPVPSIDDLEKIVTIEEIDAVLNRVVGSDGGSIIQRFKPQSKWLWKQYFGTIMFDASKPVIGNMLSALVFCILTRLLTHGDLRVFEIPNVEDHPFLLRLKLVEIIWKTLMSLTTFLLTFFVGQAYSFWRSVHDYGRGIQGRLNDLNLLLATHASRQPNGEYTPESKQFLDTMATKLRVFHLLFWASNTKRFRILLTNKGMEQMVLRGYIPAEEKQRLDQMGIAPTQRLWAVFESAIMTAQDGLRQRQIISHQSEPLERTLLEQFLRLRGTAASIPDLVDGRMPLAYAHFVQVLVDAFLVTAPIAQ